MASVSGLPARPGRNHWILIGPLHGNQFAILDGMRTSKLLSAVLAAIIGVGALGGCVLRATGTYRVRTAPPPPRHVVYESRPGWVYVDGYWAWNGYDYNWVDGYWEQDRPGYVFVRGSWHNDNGYHTYRKGYWQPRARRDVIIYKDRGNRGHYNNGHKKPTVVYDHSR